ncbi:hypothetical protein ACOTJF_28335 [Achromobacter ruhlandii]|uniref:hypothetical protein n=1 Tax=Achromobacter ruhlandii TaxID=72557 RepID=UPI003B9FCBFC
MKPSDNEIEMLAAGFAIQHKNGLIRFAHALLDKYAPQASAENDWKPAIRKFMDTAIPALAAIANAHTPDEIDALEAMPREPVIDQVRRLSQACEELSRQVRPERPKANKDGCTCPSGDGSLRHPCPMHPRADKDGGQQRAGDVDERAVLDGVRAALPEFRQQDDYLLAHGASLMSEDSHEIIHIDTLRRVIRAALSAPQAEQGERDA